MSGTLPAISTITNESNSNEFDLVAMLLAEQQSLTAVERFSALHGAGPMNGLKQDPAQARYYRELLPATPPGPGPTGRPVQYCGNLPPTEARALGRRTSG